MGEMYFIDFTRGEMSFRRGVDNPTSVVGGGETERENGGGTVKLGFISEIGRNLTRIRLKTRGRAWGISSSFP